MSYHIDYYDEENPRLVLGINGRRMEFSLMGVHPESREWLGNLLDRVIQEEIAYAVNKALNEHRAEMRALLGIQP